MNTAISGSEAKVNITRSADKHILLRVKASEAQRPRLILRDQQTNTTFSESEGQRPRPVLQDHKKNTALSGLEGQRPRLILRDQQTNISSSGSKVRDQVTKVNITISAEEHLLFRVKG
jgi:hypothetical protein